MDLRIFTEPQQGASYDTQLAAALAAEDAGFSAYFRSDHYTSFSGEGLPGPTDSWVTLGGLARETSRIRLGTLVTAATFRHPGPLAISVAQVDQMSGGRVELGIGAAWNDREHAAYAIPFPPTGERFDMLEDQLSILTGLWRTPVGEKFSHQGRKHSVLDSPALPKPVQDGGPPIIIGGGGPKRTPALAARFADEFNLPFVLMDFWTHQQRVVSDACRAIDRDPDELTWSVALTTVVGSDEAEVQRRCKAIGQRPEGLRERGLCGTPGEVVGRIREWADVGVQRIYLQILDLSDLDHIAQIGAEVRPAL